jgi:tryptophan-rich sensory protein
MGVQAMHAATMAVGVRHQTAQLIANVVTMLGGLAYAREAKEVDPPSAAIITPYVSWMAFANLIAAELWRRNVGKRGVD